MDFRRLYWTTDGRISRKTFWIGAVVLAAFNFLAALTYVSVLLTFGVMKDPAVAMPLWAWGIFGITAACAYPAYCLAVKRRHDRNSRGLDVLVYTGLTLSLSLAVVLTASSGNLGVMRPSVAGVTLNSALQVYGIYVLVVLGFLKGTDGANGYGPDPLVSTAATGNRSKTSINELLRD